MDITTAIAVMVQYSNVGYPNLTEAHKRLLYRARNLIQIAAEEELIIQERLLYEEEARAKGLG